MPLKQNGGIPQHQAGSHQQFTTPNSGSAAARKFTIAGETGQLEFDSLGTFTIAFDEDAALADTADTWVMSAHSMPRIEGMPEGTVYVSITAASDFTIDIREVK